MMIAVSPYYVVDAAACKIMQATMTLDHVDLPPFPFLA